MLTGLTSPRCPECGAGFDPSELFHEAAGCKVDVRTNLLRQALPELGTEYEGLIRSLAAELDVTLMSAVGVILQQWFDRTTDYEATAADWRRVLESIQAEQQPLIALPRPPREIFVDFPMPECEQTCPACGASLAGLTASCCSVCATEFDADALAGNEALVSLPAEPVAAGFQQAEFEMEGIPSMHVTHRHAISITHGVRLLDTAAVRVPRAYYYDALDVLQGLRTRCDDDQPAGAESPGADPQTGEWTCPGCGEAVPGHFESCWNCGGARK
jgi:hypothetical protein